MGTNNEHTDRPTHPFAGARKMKPTKKHRIAIWENMLGTVSAMNDAGRVKSFDYDWDGARTFAGVEEPDRDPRIARCDRTYGVMSGSVVGPSWGQYTLYVRRV